MEMMRELLTGAGIVTAVLVLSFFGFALWEAARDVWGR